MGKCEAGIVTLLTLKNKRENGILEKFFKKVRRRTRYGDHLKILQKNLSQIFRQRFKVRQARFQFAR